VEAVTSKLMRAAVCSACLCAMASADLISQDAPDIQDVPSNFNLDMKAAAQLRPELVAQSVSASGRYAAGRAVFERLIGEVAPQSRRLRWELRIVEDSQLNAYSSPDGTVYIESGLADLAGSSTGLWAAILSHEIAHVSRRDWARRYLYQENLEKTRGGMTLGDSALPSGSWLDAKQASADIGQFCQRIELEADREGLMLMARAGYHPDFVPALHHILHARGIGTNRATPYAMHPCWEERDRELKRAYVTASIEFERRWTEWYASPGGNPPIVVFADEPTIRKLGSMEWEIQIPMHCQNLAGAVEVVLHAGHEPLAKSDSTASDLEVRQLTGCTSPRTTITFTLANPLAPQGAKKGWTDVSVLDSSGTVLARSDLAKLR